MDLGSILQGILFALFALLSATLAAITGPTYDNLLVPELSTSALYPVLSTSSSAGTTFLTRATEFSTYLLENLVDPAIALLAIGVALVYLARPYVGRWTGSPEPLLGRLVVAVVLANFTVPVAGAILSLAGAAYPTIAGFDGGAWQHWVNLAGYGEISFSWDNGALAFVLSFVLFVLVFLLTLAIALRDAMLGVLVVLLPVFTLLWPLRPLSTLARRGWLLFVELAFLPCVMVIPLELAVGSPTILLLVGYLAVAVASPFLLSLAGTQLTAFGFPGATGIAASASQRGLGSTSSAGGSYFNAAADRLRGVRPGAGAAAAVQRLGQTAPPMTAPLLVADFLGRGTTHLVQHLRSSGARNSMRGPQFPGVKGGASATSAHE
ncbi:MAG: hypothetical protein WB778_08670 [Thermoplasmata archaeon]